MRSVVGRGIGLSMFQGQVHTARVLRILYHLALSRGLKGMYHISRQTRYRARERMDRRQTRTWRQHTHSGANMVIFSTDHLGP